MAKIIKMLEDALGSGKVIAKVSTNLDFEMVEQTDLIAIANGILAYVEGDSSIE